MSRFYFTVEYGGATYADDCGGEDFSTCQEAEAYAAVIASELSRNNPKHVSVLVTTGDGILVRKVAAPVASW